MFIYDGVLSITVGGCPLISTYLPTENIISPT
jgi:hypothetical protein